VKAAREPVRMVVLNTWRQESEVVGFHGVPNRMPPVDRWAGETLDNFLARLATAAGDGLDIWAVPVFAR